jgi:hypothetical protein
VYFHKKLKTNFGAAHSQNDTDRIYKNKTPSENLKFCLFGVAVDKKTENQIGLVAPTTYFADIGSRITNTLIKQTELSACLLAGQETQMN